MIPISKLRTILVKSMLLRRSRLALNPAVPMSASFLYIHIPVEFLPTSKFKLGFYFVAMCTVLDTRNNSQYLPLQHSHHTIPGQITHIFSPCSVFWLDKLDVESKHLQITKCPSLFKIVGMRKYLSITCCSIANCSPSSPVIMVSINFKKLWYD